MATDELSAEEIHKLKQFSHALPDEQDKLDQLKNVDIDAIVDATGVSRRNVLQVILGLAAGGVVGGLSAQEIVQAVEADASTTDSDGNVGLPGDRVDLYADGIDATSLSTESLNNVIRQKGNESVQSAINRSSAGDKVVLQPGTFTESVSISTADITVEGAGRGTLIDGGTSSALTVSANGVVINNLAVKTTAGNGNNAFGIVAADGNNNCEIRSVFVEESDDNGISIGGNQWRVVSVWADSANIDGNDVNLSANSNNCVVDDIIGAVNDNGSGNTVGDTA